MSWEIEIENLLVPKRKLLGSTYMKTFRTFISINTCLKTIITFFLGFASMSIPMYVAETAPANIRGALVSLNQLFITIGILLSSIVAGAFSTDKDNGWRYGTSLNITY